MRDDSNPSILVAACENNARIGDVVGVDETGRLLWVRLHRRWPWLAIGGLGLIGGLAIALYGGPLQLAALIAVGMVSAAVLKLRESRDQERAVALAAAGLVDDASDAFETLMRSGTRPGDQPAIDYWLAVLDRRRGRHDVALQRLERAIDGARSRPAIYGRCMWAFQLELVQLLCVRGQLEAARAVRERVVAQRGIPFRITAITADLCLAFYSTTTVDLPDDLDAWAKPVYRSRSAGVAAALLAWAAFVRGDDALCVKMTAAARPRLSGTFIAQSMPDLYAWLRAYDKLD